MISTESQAETTEEQNSVIYPTMVFVIHGGPLEAKSALLAASLAEYYLPGKVVARIMEPEERWSPISSAAATLLDELGVEVIGCRNEIDQFIAADLDRQQREQDHCTEGYLRSHSVP